MRCTDGNGCSGEMWSPLADRPPRSVAPSSTSGSHQSERFGGIWTPTSGISRRALAHERAHVVQRDLAFAQRGSGERLAVRVGALRLVGDLGRLGAVVARVGHEVLEDHLLEVAVLARAPRPAPRAPARAPPALSPMPTRIPLVNGILSSPAARIVSSRRSGCLVGRALVHDQVRVHRLEHQPLRGGHLAQPRRAPRACSTPMFVCGQHPALERPLARPGHVRHEVRVPVLGEPRRHLGVHLGLLAGEHEQLLHAAPGRVVEQPLDLVGRVQVRPVRRERAVLAVAPARPRQRQREVAREGDPAHRPESTSAAAVRAAQPTGSIPSGPFAPGAMKRLK